VVSERPARLPRSAFRTFRPIQTRWMDNDVYGHVDNVVYYSYFDTAVNGYLIERGALDIVQSSAVGLLVDTGCTFFESLAFPETLEAGLAITSLGRSSVRYAIGIFKSRGQLAAAQGHFVHVYVDRSTQRPVEIPAAARGALMELAS
jgi:acyl-CoA thioester hydrolase